MYPGAPHFSVSIMGRYLKGWFAAMMHWSTSNYSISWNIPSCPHNISYAHFNRLNGLPYAYFFSFRILFWICEYVNMWVALLCKSGESVFLIRVKAGFYFLVLVLFASWYVFLSIAHIKPLETLYSFLNSVLVWTKYQLWKGLNRK